MSPDVLLAVGIGLAALLVGTTVVASSPQFVKPLAVAAVALMCFDVVSVDVGGVAARPYQFVTLMLVAALLREKKATAPQGKKSALPFWLIVHTGLVTASAAWTISATDTAAVAIGQLYLLYMFGVYLALLKRGYITIEDILGALMWGAAISSAVAIAQFVAAYGGATWGVQYVVGLPWHRPSGLMSEPDWGSLVAAMGALIAFFRPKGSTLRRTVMLVCGAVVAMSFVRAVLIALAVVLIVSFFSSKAVRRLAVAASPLVILAGIAVFLGFSEAPQALSRLNPTEVLNARGDEGALHSRTGTLDLILTHGPERHLLGHGAGSLNLVTSDEYYALRFVGGGELNAGRGGPNLFLTNYWDLGLLGLFVTAGLAFAWIAAARRSSNVITVLWPLTLLLLVDYQANNGFRFGFTWVVFALVVYAAHLPAPKSKVEVRAQPRTAARSRDSSVQLSRR